MRISNTMLRLGVVCGCGLSGPLIADDITLSGGSQLTGSVRSINEAGVVELASDLAPEPVLLKKGTVEKVTFSSQGAVPQPPSACVELANGDLLPVTLEALNDGQLTVVSAEVGRLEIPRESLKSLQLGILKRTVIYAGPNNLAEWTPKDGEAKNWIFERNSLISNGQATASKNLPLPRQFILRFTLRWQARQMPNFQIFFADPLKAKGELCDRYYLQFGGAGLEIKRESASGNRYITIVQLDKRKPDTYPEHQLQVELRVNRRDARLHLFLNGELEGKFGDPIRVVPDGSGITLVSNTPNGNPQEISNIEVLEYDDSRDDTLVEKHDDLKTDSLITRKNDRWSGHLMEIRKTDDGQVFIFKSDFKKDMLEIPAADVATVFMAAQGAAQPAQAGHSLMLRLRGGGALQVSSCQFSDDTVCAVHPLLGKLNLLRQGIMAMERLDAKSAALERTDPKPKPKPKIPAGP